MNRLIICLFSLIVVGQTFAQDANSKEEGNPGDASAEFAYSPTTLCTTH